MLTRILYPYAKKVTALLCLLASIGNQLKADDPISCYNSINLSLNHNCESLVTFTDMLSEIDPDKSYTLMLTDPSGVLVTGNMVSSAHIGMLLTAKVTENLHGNSCWGTILVEDKIGPMLDCDPIEVLCINASDDFPSTTDACSAGEIEVEVAGRVVENLQCDPHYVQRITYQLEATDLHGNRSTCEQIVNLKKVDLDPVVAMIDYPDSLLISRGNNLICSVELDENGLPVIAATGVPLLDGIPIYPLNDVYCNMSVHYTDVVVADFGCTKKIMRTWHVNEWSCNGDSGFPAYVQSIEIADTTGPEFVSCEPVMLVDADPAMGCAKVLELVVPKAVDDCDDNLEMDVAYQGGFANNVNSNITVTLSGTSKVTYTVYDGCDNSAQCITEVIVRDNSAPVAICDRNSVVSLRSDGTAVAHSNTFDDGSFDDCDLYMTLIQREDPECPCEIPHYNNMSYLGEHEGHYYYLSDSRESAPWAMELAAAIGGHLVDFNTPEEEAWVVYAAIAIADSVYIGLYGKGSPITYVWSDHSGLAYTNWAPGQTDASGSLVATGDYVIINENGEWELVTGVDRNRYIFEVETRCAFSDRINFCCDDAGKEQTVTVKVIDGSGRYSTCTANVLVQDKVAPVISCPSDTTVVCGTNYTLNDTYSASDQCQVNSAVISVDNSGINGCGLGQIVRTFTVSDATGQGTCHQTITVTSSGGFDPSIIDWPNDYTTDQGCNGDGILPNDLPVESAFPRFSIGVCDDIATPTYSDQTFQFSGSGACSKTVRTWTVMDQCSPTVVGSNPVSYQQVIIVNNVVAPVISNCGDQEFLTSDCNPRQVDFQISAVDDCAPINSVIGNIILDEFSNGSEDKVYGPTNSSFSFSEILPVGVHSLVVNFSDSCGNTASCTKRIEVSNVTVPSVTCKPNLSVNIQEMDLDSDPTTPDDIVVMVEPDLFITSTTSPCGYNLTASFSPDIGDDLRVFTCEDMGQMITVPIFVSDSRGNVSQCAVPSILQIQDNNSPKLCPVVTSEIIVSGCSNETLTIECFMDYVGHFIEAESPDCDQSVHIEAHIDFGSDGSVDLVEDMPDSYVYHGILPEGEHFINYVISACGTTTTCQEVMTIECNPIELIIEGCTEETYNIDCELEEIYIPINVHTHSTNCNELTELSVEVDLGSDGIIDFYEEGGGSDYEYTGPLPVGTHTFNYTVTGCGETLQCQGLVTIQCQSGITISNCEDRVVVVDRPATAEVNFEFLVEGIPDCAIVDAIWDLDYNGDQVYHQHGQEPIFNDRIVLPVETLVLCGVYSLNLFINSMGSPDCITPDAAVCNLQIEVICEETQVIFRECGPIEHSIESCNDFFVQGGNCSDPVNICQGTIVSCDEPGLLIIEVDLGADGTIDEIDEVDNVLDQYSYSMVFPSGLSEVHYTLEACGEVIECSRLIDRVCITPPVISGLDPVTGCEDEIFQKENCIGNPDIAFSIAVNNQCEIDEEHTIIAKVDFHSDGTIDIREDLYTLGSYDYNFPTPVGNHICTVEVIDACNALTSCSKNFSVECIDGVAGDNTVSGRVTTEEDIAIQEVVVQLEGADFPMLTTDEIGNYTFPGMPLGGQYRVVPTKNVDHLNGVSTLDLISIQRHILGLEPLSSPYKMIAADIDRSGRINGVDLVELRKLILGIYNEFPNNTSWRILDKSSSFADESDPFISELVEDYMIYNFTSDMEVDFVGVKVGDVNNSASLNSDHLNLRASSNGHIVIEEQFLAANHIHEIILDVSESDIQGFQYAIDIDMESLELLDWELSDGLSEDNINLDKLQDGQLVVSWYNLEETVPPVITLIVEAKSNIMVSEAISLSSQLAPEFYIDDESLSLDIQFAGRVDATNVILLSQNNPNPWRTETEIRYIMPHAEEVVLSIYDINGKLLYQEQKTALKGLNSLILDRSNLNSHGVMYYELVSGNARLVHKMILLE